MTGVCRFLHRETGNRRFFAQQDKGGEQLNAYQFTAAIRMRFRKNGMRKQLLHICRHKQMFLSRISIFLAQTTCTGTDQLAASALTDRGNNPRSLVLQRFIAQCTQDILCLLDILHPDFRYRGRRHLLPIPKRRLKGRRAHSKPLLLREIRRLSVRRHHPLRRPLIPLADSRHLRRHSVLRRTVPCTLIEPRIRLTQLDEILICWYTMEK